MVNGDDIELKICVQAFKNNLMIYALYILVLNK